ncbi:MAG: AmmeMemoRadiSam system radical SAM enzyme [Lachnospiraceae bacterium]|jgi:pyruvate formate lyase activating enzyme|nr:AmmeMemoRadiSam system radical SAM enzyme [Lachnospiraceae bacterium]
MAKCEVCFRHCEIEEGGRGFCKVRTCKDGVIKPVNYGRVTSLALDPIEKKPLARFKPGSRILSVGSFGCNLRCPFCQNNEISWSDFAYTFEKNSEYLSPEELCRIATECRDKGNIGVAFTYNEPLIDYEYIIDSAKLIHENGLSVVLVSNGTADVSIAKKLEPYVDAMNVDLKGFTKEFYRDVLKGDLDCVKAFIEEAVKYAHVELTTLIIPGENDSEGEMREISSYIAGLSDEIPLHISRFFPQFHMTDRPATDVKLIYRLADVAREKLKYVYTGNC